jgi:hypothetical protein
MPSRLSQDSLPSIDREMLLQGTSRRRFVASVIALLNT